MYVFATSACPVRICLFKKVSMYHVVCRQSVFVCCKSLCVCLEKSRSVFPDSREWGKECVYVEERASEKVCLFVCRQNLFVCLDKTRSVFPDKSRSVFLDLALSNVRAHHQRFCPMRIGQHGQVSMCYVSCCKILFVCRKRVFVCLGTSFSVFLEFGFASVRVCHQRLRHAHASCMNRSRCITFRVVEAFLCVVKFYVCV